MDIFPGAAAGDSKLGWKRRSLEILWKYWGLSETLSDAVTI